MPQSIYERSPEFLRSYCDEHLWYEVSMFFHTGRSLPFGAMSPAVEWNINAVLESFVIHLRNLLDFFYPVGKPRKTDVVAAEYFEGNDLTPDFPTESPLLLAAKLRAHKHVSHLTTERIAGSAPEKAWHPEPLMVEMALLLRLFTERALAEKLSPAFVVQVNKIARFDEISARPGT
jgi:hypothetical protein